MSCLGEARNDVIAEIRHHEARESRGDPVDGINVDCHASRPMTIAYHEAAHHDSVITRLKGDLCNF